MAGDEHSAADNVVTVSRSGLDRTVLYMADEVDLPLPRDKSIEAEDHLVGDGSDLRIPAFVEKWHSLRHGRTTWAMTERNEFGNGRMKSGSAKAVRMGPIGDIGIRLPRK
jgi:hypothetical protein